MYTNSHAFACYCHDFQKELRSIFSKQHGDCSVMVWRRFLSMIRRPKRSSVVGSQNSENYEETIANDLLPVKEILRREDWIFHFNAYP